MLRCLILVVLVLLCDGANPYCQGGLPQYIPPPSTDWTLLHATVITRHGARAPANVLPNEDVAWNCGATDLVDLTPVVGTLERIQYISPMNAYSPQMWSGNCTVGQLTALGAQQHYAMGQALRSIYVDQYKLLSQNYNENEVYIRSKDVWRTQQSAEANLLGLYPFPQRGGIVPVINITPANIETMGQPCAEWEYLINQGMQSAAWKVAQSKMQPLYESLNTICGTSNNAAWDGSQGIDHFFDMSMSRTCQGLPLPCKNGQCISSSDLSAIQQEGDWEFNFLRQVDGFAKAFAGAFVYEFMQPMISATSGAGGVKYAFYSSDDDTIGALLAGFNVATSVWPPFAANLIFELWIDNSSAYYVRTLYNGEIVHPHEESTSSSAVAFMPWVDFEKLASSLYLNNVTQCTPTGGNLHSDLAKAVQRSTK